PQDGRALRILYRRAPLNRRFGCPTGHPTVHQPFRQQGRERVRQTEQVEVAGAPPTIVVTAEVGSGGAVMVLVSSVTAPFRASVRPVTRTPVVTVMLVNARMFPVNDVVVPIVAELPTCQNTFPGDPPF